MDTRPINISHRFSVDTRPIRIENGCVFKRKRIRIDGALEANYIFVSSRATCRRFPSLSLLIVIKKCQISISKILQNKLYHPKVPANRFYLNGHTIGFRQQPQKLKLQYVSVPHGMKRLSP